MKIIEEIVRISHEKNISQQQICQELGINSSTFSTWKKRGTTPPAQYIPLICQILNLPSDYFFQPFITTAESKSQLLFKLLRITLGEEDANLAFDVLGLTLDQGEFELSEVAAAWISTKCKIPKEYILNYLDCGLPRMYEEILAAMCDNPDLATISESTREMEDAFMSLKCERYIKIAKGMGLIDTNKTNLQNIAQLLIQLGNELQNI